MKSCEIREMFTKPVSYGDPLGITWLHKPLLQRRASIATLLYNLSEEKQHQLAAETCSTHILEEAVRFYDKIGDWRTYLEACDSGPHEALRILKKKIFMGIQAGINAEKTKVPFDLFYNRSQDVKNTIFNIFPELKRRNPFMSGFKSELKKIHAQKDLPSKKVALRNCLSYVCRS